ncbi:MULTISPECIES: TadE/TadG family type IV pilus assembly protein [unclassified Bradyrhizobium]|uniref:TadE/TadG family type IV pilus assembly protein n=1 Tax=unclassified Bradyrhizobium TaxID=2631580 RepID=UPI0020B267EE|nr:MULTISPECIES: TadE/TadG family type IV pilus assembly protein [unclassified Bradyrhizobium]MCP3385265.1 pilus assembly protein [Bradyrhizobium sp. CCGUVB4N]
MAIPGTIHHVARLVSRLKRDSRGNVAAMFAIALVPLIASIGCAIDYSMATRIKAKLQGSADSAGVASISVNSAGYNAAMAMTSNGSVGAGVTEANNVFNGNAATFSGSYTNLGVTSTVTKTGNKLVSNVQFSADVPVTFMQLLGYRKLTVTGSSSSTTTLPLYLDFYLTLDVSGSMGLPSTTAEAQRMQSINPDNYRQYPTGCTLACHFSPQNSACTDSGTQGYPTNNYCLGYAISRVSQSGYRGLLQTKTSNPMGVQLPSSIVSGLPNSLYSNLATVANCPTDGTDSCIQLRLDAVGYAVNQLFVTANNTEKVANQFRIGLYPFIRYLYSYFPLTSSINGSTTNSSTINYAAANLATLLDTNMNTNLGSGGTHIDTALSSVNTLITSVGDGSAWNNTLPYVFLVTDGAQDPQVKGVPNGSWSGSNHATTIDPATSCTPLKNRGVIISVLYIPYQKINPVNTSFAGDEDDYANWNIPNIPASLQNCASPGFFYTANTPADITAALNAMFNHAVQEARITN